MRRLRAPLLLLALGLLAARPPAGCAEDPPNPAMEEARAVQVRDLRRDLRKWAQGPYAAAHREEILKALGALHTLDGVEAAKAALEAVFMADAEVRDRVFALVEKVHDRLLVEPLAALVEHKELRRDFELHRRVARALTVTAHASAVPPLTGLIASEDAQVVAQAADGLATFAELKVEQKREAVQRLIDLYESTRNLMDSVRPEDKVASKVAHQKWEIFGTPLRQALQALTGQQLTRPKDWRRWWNDHKKDSKWVPGGPPDGR